MFKTVKEIWKNLELKEKKYLKVGLLYIVGFGFIAITILPLILTNKYCSVIDFTQTGNIGDTIGGIASPFIGILGAVLTFFAFYIQYKANKLVQDQFKTQQFESQYFKMIDIYRDNVSDWEFTSRITEEPYRGKAVAHVILTDFNTLCNEVFFFFLCNKVNTIETYNNLVKPDYLLKLKSLNQNVDIPKWIKLEIAYLCIFFGVDELGRINIFHHTKDLYNNEIIIKLLNFLSHKPAHKKLEEKKVWETSPNYIIKASEEPAPNNFTKFYNGNQNLFAHHYRHLYNSVRYVNKLDNIEYEKKWEYIKLLRTQLSNHEQILFFLNSISVIGRDWELNRINKKESSNLSFENKRLITKYDLIKNIPKGDQERYDICKFYPNIEFEDKEGNTILRSELEKNWYT